MPKIVDHQARKLMITRAVAHLIERESIQAVSVRSVAAEAGVEPSTLRHYFPSSDAMLAATITMIRDDQSTRLAILGSTGEAKEVIRAAWLHALPLDEARRTETHVWLGVTAVARTEALRSVLADINQGLDHLCTVTVRVYAPDSDADREAVILRAFTDGLAVNAIAEPEAFTARTITEALDTYLSRLAHPRKAHRPTRDR